MSDPVFPSHKPGYGGGEYHLGLTKRELFAAMAMQGMLAQVDDNSNPTTWEGNPSNMARIAVTCADALLAELAKPQEVAP